jgi:hypothetical protein
MKREFDIAMDTYSVPVTQVGYIVDQNGVIDPVRKVQGNGYSSVGSWPLTSGILSIERWNGDASSYTRRSARPD